MADISPWRYISYDLFNDVLMVAESSTDDRAKPTDLLTVGGVMGALVQIVCDRVVSLDFAVDDHRR